MKIKQITEAKYADPRMAKLQSVLEETDYGHAVRNGYMILYTVEDTPHIVTMVEFGNQQVGPNEIDVYFVDSDDSVGMDLHDFLDNITVLQTKRIM